MKQDFISTLTLDEVETIENLSGRAMDELMDAGQLKGKALKAIIWVVRKREDPNFKMEDAGKVSVAEALDLFKGDAEDPKA